MVLDAVSSPADLRGLNAAQLRALAAETREFIVKATGVTSMTYAQAACVPCPGVTAWNAQLAINSPSPKPLPPPDSERASAPKN